MGQGAQDLVSVAGLCRRVADPKPQLAGIAACLKKASECGFAGGAPGSACVLGRDRQRRGEGEAARGRVGRRWGGGPPSGGGGAASRAVGLPRWKGQARREPWGSKQARGVGRPGGWS